MNYKKTLYACYIGYITQAIVNNLAPILFIIFQNAFEVSLEEIGRLIFINFAVQIITDLLAMKYADRIGYRKLAVGAHICCGVGLIGLGVLPFVLPPYLGLVVAVCIYAVGGGLIEVLISPIVESLPGEEKASAMSLLHSFYCWGQMGVVLVSTLLLAVVGTSIWPLLPVIWAIIPLGNAVAFTRVPLVQPVAVEEQTSLGKLLCSRMFLIALLLMLCAGASELTMSQWSSLFAEKGLGVSKVAGDLLGPCLFAFFMGIGRTLYGLWGSKINLEKALMASAVMCIGCYSLTVFAPLPMLSLLGCALCGFSVSLMWPGMFSLTAAKYPLGGTAMFGLLAVFGDLGAASGPWLAGVVAELTGGSLKTGLLGGMIFPIALLIGVVLLGRKKQGEVVPATCTIDEN